MLITAYRGPSYREPLVLFRQFCYLCNSAFRQFCYLCYSTSFFSFQIGAIQVQESRLAVAPVLPSPPPLLMSLLPSLHPHSISTLSCSQTRLNSTEKG